tara:strand:- start:70 stop:282 length:213 start_codon:yes stop_codon:yes gene_type:complete
VKRLAGSSFLPGIRKSVFPVIFGLPEEFFHMESLGGEPLPQNQNKIDKGDIKIPSGFHKRGMIHKTMEIT